MTSMGMRFERLMRAAARMSRTRYPAFLLGLPLARREIPVFTYHDVRAEDLAADLEFLRANRYRTLCLDEFLGARQSRSTLRRSVLLTFDDARRSFWTTALPLLRDFDARAVLFAPTYWMDAPAQRPHRSGRAHTEPLGQTDDLFMSWQELRACVQSGRVDVQSHAHRHALVAVSDRLVDFANPQALARYDLYDWPMRVTVTGEDELGSPALGTPVYRSTPLLSAGCRYLESAEAAQACRDHVARAGGAAYFQRPDWRAQLQPVLERQLARHRGGLLAPAAFDRLVESEFELSRAAFEQHLGYAPSCMAFPWMLGSRRSLQLAHRHGLRAVFGVALDYRAERRPQPLPAYGRLKCDWLRLLPGTRRRSVLAIVRDKLVGFAKVQHLAH